eukprot:558189-Rhodomonas_salina.1
MGSARPAGPTHTASPCTLHAACTHSLLQLPWSRSVSCTELPPTSVTPWAWAGGRRASALPA